MAGMPLVVLIMIVLPNLVIVLVIFFNQRVEEENIIKARGFTGDPVECCFNNEDPGNVLKHIAHLMKIHNVYLL